MQLQNYSVIKIKQVKELAELFGFETRNKYSIADESGQQIGYAAEQGKGLLGLLLRSFLGHWRTFDVHFFDIDRKLQFVGKHPFRWIFQCLEIYNEHGRYLGKLEQRFGLLTKKFDLHDQNDQVIAEMRSGLLQFWTFPITRNGHKCAVISKKWSGLLKEAFLDADNFVVQFEDPTANENLRKVILASAIFIDLQYFERKADS